MPPKKAAIDGAFGLVFGQDLKPLLTGKRANERRHYFEEPQLAETGEEWWYKQLKTPPKDLSKSLAPDTKVEYMALLDYDGKAVEYVATAFISSSCEADKHAEAIFNHLNTKYSEASIDQKLVPEQLEMLAKHPQAAAAKEMLAMQKKNHLGEAMFSDTTGNTISLQCKGFRFRLQYSSKDLLAKFVDSIRAKERRQIENIRKNVGDGL